MAEGKGSKICNRNMVCLILLAAAVLLNIKYIFVDFGIDGEYQIAMAYRLLRGDILFKEMWEAHQMSTFLCAFFMKIYLSLFQTTTGIVLYLQIVGVLLDGSIAGFLYWAVNKYLGCRNAAFAMAWLFFVISPKDMPMAEFANMQVWFCVLLCITLFLYYETKKKSMVILAALSLCAAVLSYPSCLILVVGIAFLFWHYGEKKNFFQDFILFMGVCVVTGIGYLCLTLKNLTIDEFFVFFENMQLIETAHATGIVDKFAAYLKDAAEIAVIFGVVYLIAWGLTLVICRKKSYAEDKEARRIVTDSLFFILLLFVCLYTVILLKVYIRYCYSVSFVAVILIGMRHARKLSADKFFFYICGTTISLLNFLSTLILTDLELVGSLPYLLIALVAAVLPISEILKRIENRIEWKAALGGLVRVTIAAGAVFLMFRSAYVIRPMYLQAFSIFEVGGVVKAGPALGIFSDYMGAYMQNESIKEWEEYIEEGSNIYLIGDPLDILGYLYLDTNVAAPSVVSTPGYNEGIAKYWEMNPDKYPDVVIASCWYGTLNSALSEDSWIMKWLEEEFKPEYYVDGKYWRYYFR